MLCVTRYFKDKNRGLKKSFLVPEQLLGKAKTCCFEPGAEVSLRSTITPHVGRRHLCGQSARLGHCLGLYLIPQVTVSTDLTSFTSCAVGVRQRLGTTSVKDLNTVGFTSSLSPESCVACCHLRLSVSSCLIKDPEWRSQC